MTLTSYPMGDRCQYCVHLNDDQSEYHYCHICCMEYDCFKQKDDKSGTAYRLYPPSRKEQGRDWVMDKWTELRETIQELHEANRDKPDVENVTRFLLNLMDVLDGNRKG